MSNNGNQSEPLGQVVSYKMLCSIEELEAHVGEWMQLECIGLDTEFMRSDTFYAKPGLLQVSDGRSIYLVDPLAIGDLSAFGRLLYDARVAKVMHAMSEDIDLLFHCTGVLPRSVFDTQVAAALCGYGSGLSYQNLSKQILGVELEKSETRSDWLQRPLSASQLNYAALDVRDILELYACLRERLLSRHLCEAAFEECQSLVDSAAQTWSNPEAAYLKVKGGWDLSLPKQMLLKQLVTWRDALAVEMDLPRSWIFSDAQLLEVCQKSIRSLAVLSQVKRVKPKQIKLYGKQLLEQVLAFEPEDPAFFTAIDRPLKGQEMALYKSLKADVAVLERDYDIAASILGSRKMLEKIVLHVMHQHPFEWPAEYRGWRKAIVGERFSQTIEAYITEFEQRGKR